MYVRFLNVYFTVRPWYVETNVPAPKQLVLMVDISNSMRKSTANGETLMRLAHQAAKTVINTLNAKDKVNLHNMVTL